MILQALTEYYEALQCAGSLPGAGWEIVKFAWALELDLDGNLLQVHPLKEEVTVGKKQNMVPRRIEVPRPEKRAVNITSNFLWDHSGYLLGIDKKGKPARTAACFADAARLHKALLSELSQPEAVAICRFFENWNPLLAGEHPALQQCMDELMDGENITFMVDGVFAVDVPQLREAWQANYDSDDNTSSADEDTMRCLITGQSVVPEAIHPNIKGVVGAQSSGASMVSFNANSFCSYGREQNLNAPIGKAAAAAYTAALNYLIGTRDANGIPRFSKRIGDMTVVFWAQDAQEVYQDLTASILSGDEGAITNDELAVMMDKLSKGSPVSWNEQEVNPNNRFYVLGISPNASRLSLRFFAQNSFGTFVRNIAEHYKRLEIVRPSYDKWVNIPLYWLLDATVSKMANDKTPHKQMAGDVLEAILTGARYPATLYQQTMLRTRAEKDLPRARAAIIKAYLLRNEAETYKEVITVELNESTSYLPYVLGRIFSVLEEIQEKANPGINATIKDKYFSSASTTPSVVFPVLISLAQKHLRKIDGFYHEKKLGELMGMVSESFPSHLSLHEQGVFQLGYYHQTQKRYEKKESTQQGGTENV